MTRKLLLSVPFLLCFALALAGCNIFGWTAKEDQASLLDQGHDLMREAKYAEAAVKYAEAMENDPDDSDARYYHAKATVHASGFNALGLANVMSDFESTGNDLPFHNWSDDSLTLLHQTVGTVFDDLKPIMDGTTKGNFDALDVDLDMGIAASIRVFTLWKDIDGDDIIDAASDFDIDFVSGDFFALKAGTILDFLQSNDTNWVPGAGRLAGANGFAAGMADTLYVDTALIVSWNNLLDQINEVLQYSVDVLIAIIEAHLDSSGQYDGEYDIEDINDLLDQVQMLSRIYKVNDHVIPDDINSDYFNSDSMNDALVNEEALDGIDNDGDGWIDEDGYYTGPWLQTSE